MNLNYNWILKQFFWILLFYSKLISRKRKTQSRLKKFRFINACRPDWFSSIFFLSMLHYNPNANIDVTERTKDPSVFPTILFNFRLLWRCSDKRRGSSKNHVQQNEFLASLRKSKYAFQMQEIEYFTLNRIFLSRNKTRNVEIIFSTLYNLRKGKISI